MNFATLRNSLAREQRFLIIFVGIIALIWGFGALAGEVLEGETKTFDEFVTYLFRLSDHVTPIGDPWLPNGVRDLTSLGSVTVLTFLSILATAFLLFRSRWRMAIMMGFATGGGAMFSVVLKDMFARPRPEIVPHLVPVDTLSFPSGHATNSAIIYLTIAMLLARNFEERSTRIFIIASAVTLVIGIGLSRIYLGVHYPSDVVAGWMVGAAWALAMGEIAHRLQLHHKVEQPEDEPTEPTT